MSKEKEQNTDFMNELSDNTQLNISDINIPFLKIAQQLSPICEKGSEEYNDKAEPGHFYNSVTNELIGPEVFVIPIDYERIWLEWKLNRGGLVGRHLPESIKVDKTDFSKWIRDDGVAMNEISETLSFYCLNAKSPNDGLIVLSLQSSGIKHAKNWNTQISQTRLGNGAKAPFFSSIWKLVTKKNQNDQGTWYTIGVKSTSVERVRFINEEEYTKHVQPMLADMSNLKMQLDYNNLETKQVSDITIQEGEKLPY